MIAARRFFVEGANEIGESVEIGGADAHKIANVLRLSPGDRIVVIDSTARTFTAAIAAVGRVVCATIEEEIFDDRAPAAAMRIDVAQAVPKGRRMDFVVEKGSELGVEAFLPFYCERSVGRDVGAEKAARWQRIARAAAQQCGRKSVPDVLEVMPYSTLLERFGEYDAVLFAWELATPAPLPSASPRRYRPRGGCWLSSARRAVSRTRKRSSRSAAAPQCSGSARAFYARTRQLLCCWR